MTVEVKRVFQASDTIFGHRIVHQKLQHEGIPVAVGTVATIMAQNGWKARRTRAFKRTTRQDDGAKFFPDLIRRNFTAAVSGTVLQRWLESKFEGLGDVMEVPEAGIDVVSSISGSGLAYIYYLVEQLTATAIDKGFTAEQAAILVNGTLTGSAALLTSSGLEPRELRRQVTSPKGTTERAIAVLEAANLSELFDRATDAAIARSRELSLGS